MHDTMPTTVAFKTKGFFAAKTKTLFVFSPKRNEFSYRFSGIGSQCQIRCPPLQSAPKQKMIAYKIPFFFRSRFFKMDYSTSCPVSSQMQKKRYIFQFRMGLQCTKGAHTRFLQNKWFIWSFSEKRVVFHVTDGLVLYAFLQHFARLTARCWSVNDGRK